MEVCQLQQPLRKLSLRLLPEPLPVVSGKTAAREHRALARDPFNMALRERIGLPARAAARNRDADAAVEFDAEQIPSRSPMAYEVHRCNGGGGCRTGTIPENRRPRSRLTERKAQLHARQDTRFTKRA